MLDYILNQGIIVVSKITLPQMNSDTADAQKCKKADCTPEFQKFTSYVYPDNKVFCLLKHLQSGPISVNPFAPDQFTYYYSGVLDSTDCFHQNIIDNQPSLLDTDLMRHYPI